MKAVIPLIFFLSLTTVSITTFSGIETSYLSPFEQGIIEETNLARTAPKMYATKLKNLKKTFQGNLMTIPGKEAVLVTIEGVKAVEEAIKFLESIQSLPPLKPVKGLSLAARDHVNNQGTTTETGHTGRDDSQVADRANRYGDWHTIVGENISYGPDNAENVVMQLIINDGIPNRSHRQNIFQQAYRVTGVACGKHKRYTSMCVITYADGFTERTVQ